MVRIAMFGAGRIGHVHGPNLARSSSFDLAGISDPVAQSASALADRLGCVVLERDQIFADDSIAAVLIASSTNTHAELIEAAARAGKFIFCEKPIDLDSARARSCLRAVEAEQAQLAIGFNRRFDPNFAELKRRLRDGVAGDIEMVSLVSHDPEPPWPAYVRVSGGLFRDMMIHDFDMARWVLGEDPVEVFATGSVLIDPEIGEAGDVDSAMVVMRTESGKLCHINCSRRNLAGYDQRIEVHGSKAKLFADNVLSTSLRLADASGSRLDPPPYASIDRYGESYRRELELFAEGVERGSVSNPDGVDGLNALLLADAATESHHQGRTLAVSLA